MHSCTPRSHGVLMARTASCSLKSTSASEGHNSYTVFPSLLADGVAMRPIPPWQNESKREKACYFVWPTTTSHMCSSMPFPLHQVEAVTTKPWGPGETQDGSSLVPNWLREEEPPYQPHSEPFCEQEINFYCVNLLAFWNLLPQAAFS